MGLRVHKAVCRQIKGKQRKKGLKNNRTEARQKDRKSIVTSEGRRGGQ